MSAAPLATPPDGSSKPSIHAVFTEDQQRQTLHQPLAPFPEAAASYEERDYCTPIPPQVSGLTDDQTRNWRMGIAAHQKYQQEAQQQADGGGGRALADSAPSAGPDPMGDALNRALNEALMQGRAHPESPPPDRSASSRVRRSRGRSRPPEDSPAAAPPPRQRSLSRLRSGLLGLSRRGRQSPAPSPRAGPPARPPTSRSGPPSSPRLRSPPPPDRSGSTRHQGKVYKVKPRGSKGGSGRGALSVEEDDLYSA